MENSDIIPVAVKLKDDSIGRIVDFFETDGWKYIEKYGSDFGVDPYLLLAVAYAESELYHEKHLPGGSNYNGCAFGRFQLENPSDEWDVKAYNYNTNEWETVRLNVENAMDEELNTKLAAMYFQQKFKSFNNNIYLSIQAYNYGSGAVNKIITKYAEEINCDVEDVKNNYTDIGWMKYVDDLHINPKEYLGSGKGTYGDNEYVTKVIGYYLGTETTNYDKEGNIVTINLLDMSNSYGTISR